jgi:hypothetical protein
VAHDNVIGAEPRQSNFCTKVCLHVAQTWKYCACRGHTAKPIFHRPLVSRQDHLPVQSGNGQSPFAVVLLNPVLVRCARDFGRPGKAEDEEEEEEVRRSRNMRRRSLGQSFIIAWIRPNFETPVWLLYDRQSWSVTNTELGGEGVHVAPSLSNLWHAAL